MIFEKESLRRMWSLGGNDGEQEHQQNENGDPGVRRPMIEEDARIERLAETRTRTRMRDQVEWRKTDDSDETETVVKQCRRQRMMMNPFVIWTKTAEGEDPNGTGMYSPIAAAACQQRRSSWNNFGDSNKYSFAKL